jgi:hypothetical protein
MNKRHIFQNRFEFSRKNPKRGNYPLKAVKTYVWITIFVFVLVIIVKKQLNLDLSLYSILQIMGVTLLEKISISQALTGFDSHNKLIDPDKQLMLFNL